MRVLFKDQEDGTLFVAEIDTVSYCQDARELYFRSADDDDITVPGISSSEADNIIKQLFDYGARNMSAYPAWINEEPDEEHLEEDENTQKQEENSFPKTGFGGLFGKKQKAKDPWET